MPFRATNQLLADAYRNCKVVAAQQKVYLGQWSVLLQSDFSALTASDIVANLNRVIDFFTQMVALPGIVDHARVIENDPAYDVAAAFTEMLNAHTEMRSWLTTNIPANAITVVNGVATGATYPPATTAPLKALVDAAALTIV